MQLRQSVLAACRSVYRSAYDVSAKILLRQHRQGAKEDLVTFPTGGRGDKSDTNAIGGIRWQAARRIDIKHWTVGVEARQVDTVVYGRDLQFVAADLLKITGHAIGVSDRDGATACVNSYQRRH